MGSSIVGRTFGHPDLPEKLTAHRMRGRVSTDRLKVVSG